MAGPLARYRARLRRLQQLPCPWCQVAAGQRCRSWRGRPLKDGYEHFSRRPVRINGCPIPQLVRRNRWLLGCPSCDRWFVNTAWQVMSYATHYATVHLGKELTDG